MRTATVLSAILAAGLSVGAMRAEAQNSANINATASVLSAVTVTAANDLQFGNVTPGVNKTVAITDAGAGRFNVVKASNQGVTLTFTLPTNLSDGTNNLPIGTWTGGWNTSATPVGATGFTPSGTGTNTAATAGTTIFVYVGATVTRLRRRSPGITPTPSPCRRSTSKQRLLPRDRPDAPVEGGRRLPRPARS